MELLKISNNYSKVLVLDANNFFARLKGLIGRKLNDSTGILLTPCNQVHTFFMSESIDVIFISSKNQVIHIEEQMPPSKFGKRMKGAKRVLELKGGISKQLNINIGDTLVMEKA